MKFLAVAGLSILIILVGIQIYSFLNQEHALSVSLATTQASLTKAQFDEADLSANVQYLANPANLEKEFRAQFNYKKPGETMVVIVPSASSTNN